MVSTELFDLSGKVALLTGASKGMGLAMAEGLAEHGARVMLSSRKLDQCEAAAAEINAKCGEERVFGHACNAGYKDQLQALVDATHERLGTIDVLVGNAGVNPFFGPMSEISDEAYDKIMSTNVKANHWLVQMVASDMIERGSGSIMITSSTGAFSPSPVLGTYNISKLAVIALVRNLAGEGSARSARERYLSGPDQDGVCAGALGQPSGRAARKPADTNAASGRSRGPEGSCGVLGV